MNDEAYKPRQFAAASENLRLKKAILFGVGTIGSALVKRLAEEGVEIIAIVRSSKILDKNMKEIAKRREWQRYADMADVAFVSIPTESTGETSFMYDKYFLERGKPVIACEKAAVVHHWDELKKYGDLFKYSASVGGETRMPKAIKEMPRPVTVIKAVVNATMNSLSESKAAGKTDAEALKIVLDAGAVENGEGTLVEIIKTEWRDVKLKAAILANESGMFNRTITDEDVKWTSPPIGDIGNKRCIVRITKDGVEAGFIEDGNAEWLPKGLNNILCIDDIRIAQGLGAGAEPTVSAMLQDFRELSVQ